MIRKWVWGALLIALLGGLVGCVGGEATPALLVVTDALGREVQLPAPPQRIVITGRANFMLTNALYLFPDVPQRVLGLTRSSQQAAAFVQLLDSDAVTKTRFISDTPVEEIAAAQPDLVLLKSYLRESLGATFEQLGIPVIYLELETPEQYQRDLATLGQALGNPERAAELGDYYQGILDRVAQGVADLPEAEKPRVLLLQYSGTGDDVAFKVPPASWIQTTLVTLSGGRPIWLEAAQGSGWAVVNLEQIAAWNPDQIYIIHYGGAAADVVAQLQADPQWAQMAAVRAGQLYPFAGDLYSWDQPDARWGLGLLWLAQHIQPERFADVDMQAEVYRFFGELYGLERAVIDAQLMPLINLSQP